MHLRTNADSPLAIMQGEHESDDALWKGKKSRIIWCMDQLSPENSHGACLKQTTARKKGGKKKREAQKKEIK